MGTYSNYILLMEYKGHIFIDIIKLGEHTHVK